MSIEKFVSAYYRYKHSSALDAGKPSYDEFRALYDALPDKTKVDQLYTNYMKEVTEAEGREWVPPIVVSGVKAEFSDITADLEWKEKPLGVPLSDEEIEAQASAWVQLHEDEMDKVEVTPSFEEPDTDVPDINDFGDFELRVIHAVRTDNVGRLARLMAEHQGRRLSKHLPEEVEQMEDFESLVVKQFGYVISKNVLSRSWAKTLNKAYSDDELVKGFIASEKSAAEGELSEDRYRILELLFNAFSTETLRKHPILIEAMAEAQREFGKPVTAVKMKPRARAAVEEWPEITGEEWREEAANIPLSDQEIEALAAAEDYNDEYELKTEEGPDKSEALGVFKAALRDGVVNRDMGQIEQAIRDYFEVDPSEATIAQVCFEEYIREGMAFKDASIDLDRKTIAVFRFLYEGLTNEQVEMIEDATNLKNVRRLHNYMTFLAGVRGPVTEEDMEQMSDTYIFPGRSIEADSPGFLDQPDSKPKASTLDEEMGELPARTKILKKREGKKELAMHAARAEELVDQKHEESRAIKGDSANQERIEEGIPQVARAKGMAEGMKEEWFPQGSAVEVKHGVAERARIPNAESGTAQKVEDQPDSKPKVQASNEKIEGFKPRTYFDRSEDERMRLAKAGVEDKDYGIKVPGDPEPIPAPVVPGDPEALPEFKVDMPPMRRWDVDKRMEELVQNTPKEIEYPAIPDDPRKDVSVIPEQEELPARTKVLKKREGKKELAMRAVMAEELVDQRHEESRAIEGDAATLGRTEEGIAGIAAVGFIPELEVEDVTPSGVSKETVVQGVKDVSKTLESEEMQGLEYGDVEVVQAKPIAPSEDKMAQADVKDMDIPREIKKRRIIEVEEEADIPSAFDVIPTIPLVIPAVGARIQEAPEFEVDPRLREDDETFFADGDDLPVQPILQPEAEESEEIEDVEQEHEAVARLAHNIAESDGLFEGRFLTIRQLESLPGMMERKAAIRMQLYRRMNASATEGDEGGAVAEVVNRKVDDVYNYVYDENDELRRSAKDAPLNDKIDKMAEEVLLQAYLVQNRSLGVRVLDAKKELNSKEMMMYTNRAVHAFQRGLISSGALRGALAFEQLPKWQKVLRFVGAPVHDFLSIPKNLVNNINDRAYKTLGYSSLGLMGIGILLPGAFPAVAVALGVAWGVTGVVKAVEAMAGNKLGKVILAPLVTVLAMPTATIYAISMLIGAIYAMSTGQSFGSIKAVIEDSIAPPFSELRFLMEYTGTEAQVESFRKMANGKMDNFETFNKELNQRKAEISKDLLALGSATELEAALREPTISRFVRDNDLVEKMDKRLEKLREGEEFVGGVPVRDLPVQPRRHAHKARRGSESWQGDVREQGQGGENVERN